MKTPQSPDYNSPSPDYKLPRVSEYALILGAGASAAASIAAQQLAAASIPVTTLVALGMLNRYRLDQRIKAGESVGPTLDETTPHTRSVRSQGVSSQPMPESGSPSLRPMSAATTVATARFSRHYDYTQENLEALQKASLQKIGGSLRQARQEKGLSVEEIYQQTFIQVYNLKALEEGNLRCLPEPFYIRAFIQKYAMALGLDGKQLVAEFPGET